MICHATDNIVYGKLFYFVRKLIYTFFKSLLNLLLKNSFVSEAKCETKNITHEKT